MQNASWEHKTYAFKYFWLFLRSLSCIGRCGRLVGQKIPKFCPNHLATPSVRFIFRTDYWSTNFVNSVSQRRIWTRLGENSSCKPPGASHTAQRPQKQQENINNVFVRTYGKSNNSLMILLSASLNNHLNAH